MGRGGKEGDEIFVVRVPQETANWYVKLTSQAWGEIMERYPAPPMVTGEAQTVWRQQISSARERLSAFNDPDNPNRAEIDKNLKTFIQKAYSNHKPLDEIDWESVHQALSDYLGVLLTDDIPKGIRTRRQSRPQRIEFINETSGLLPHHVSIILDGYGLVNGTIIPYTDIARIHGVNPTTVSSVLSKDIEKISKNRRLRERAQQPYDPRRSS